MSHLLKTLCEEISLCKFGYSQSDEASFVLYSTKIGTEPWFGNNLQKIGSLTASLATLSFNVKWAELRPDDHRCWKAQFDSRAFILPEHEVENYFIWRSNDAVRNSVEATAHANFSQKSINGLNSQQLQEKLFSEKGINWNDTPTRYKRGFACRKVLKEVVTPNGTVERMKWELDYEMPVLTSDRSYVGAVLEEV
jgi:tRNA(His) 5'-end guanylyltransferase